MDPAPVSPWEKLTSTVADFFRRPALLAAGDRVLVAFSGGPDSTALLRTLAALRQRLGVEIEAAHLDHGLDEGSARRALTAAAICEELNVRMTAARVDVGADRRPGESPEEAARRIRYRFLESTRLESGSRWIATAHHRDDQIETVLLRLSHGSGWSGLAGIPRRRGRIVRPLLGLGRCEIAAALSDSSLEPAADPSNLELGVPRNRLRLALLPYLVAEDPRLPDAVLGVAEAARGARRAVGRRLDSRLGIAGEPWGASLAAGALSSLPSEVWPLALARLHRKAKIRYPPSAAAVRDLQEQFRRGGGVGCDCGSAWVWRLSGERLQLRRRRRPTPAFAYTLAVPGQIDLPEIRARFSIREERVAPWMFEGSPRRAGLSLPLRRGALVTVRNRRPGDRLQPLGCAYARRLKDVLIDRRIPREKRDAIPLLCIEDRIAWVPGVTIDEAFRLGDDATAWLAEIEDA